MSQFDNVFITEECGDLEIYNAYEADISPLKADLVYGTYRSEDGSQYLLPVVKKAECMIIDETLDHGYLSPYGIDDFSKLGTTLLLGNIEKQWEEGTIFGVQTVGGSGALKLGAEFLTRYLECTTFYYSNPTWEMHEPIFMLSGFQNKVAYRYLDEETKSLDFEGLMEDISNAPQNSMILLHVCGHNPTGIDLTKKQWKELAEIVKERKLIPFFDIAYHGLASGDLEEDSWAIRYFYSEGIEFLCAQSFSKTFTIYNDRAGNLVVSLKSANTLNSVKELLSRMARAFYLTPPNHGAQIVYKILATPELFNEWLTSFKSMASRIKELRKAFRKILEEVGAPGKWNHVTDQSGLFLFLNLTDSQMKYLQDTHHVYLATCGRMNVTAMNKNNIRYIAEALNDTLRKNK